MGPMALDGVIDTNMSILGVGYSGDGGEDVARGEGGWLGGCMRCEHVGTHGLVKIWGRDAFGKVRDGVVMGEAADHVY